MRETAHSDAISERVPAVTLDESREHRFKRDAVQRIARLFVRKVGHGIRRASMVSKPQCRRRARRQILAVEYSLSNTRVPAKKKPSANASSKPLAGTDLIKEVNRRIRAAKSLWDAHSNAACRGERASWSACLQVSASCVNVTLNSSLLLIRCIKRVAPSCVNGFEPLHRNDRVHLGGIEMAYTHAQSVSRRLRAVGTRENIIPSALAALFNISLLLAAPPDADDGTPQPMYREREPAAPISPPWIPPVQWSDCNGDGVNDLSSVWPDCDGDGEVDWCQIARFPALDCDGDLTLDACELGRFDADCNGNGVLDECEPQFGLPEFPGGPPETGWPDDCDANGISDRLEICRHPDADCDGDGTLDVCQLVNAPVSDCDKDGGLDSCQIAMDPTLDCNRNGVLDRCERVCEGVSVSGPLFLGDFDWGIWQISDLPLGCTFIGVRVLYGPLTVRKVEFPRFFVQADLLDASQEFLGALRVTISCHGCECFIDVPVTVQAYDRIVVELRAFIPCGVACAVDPSFPPLFFNCFVGDCRDFDCAVTPLPTSVVTPSSRCLSRADFGMALRATAGFGSELAASVSCASWSLRSPSDYSQCGGQTVPVGDSSTNCEWSCGAPSSPCPTDGVIPDSPTIVDASCAGPPFGDVSFVGSPRCREVCMTLAETNTCLATAPSIDARCALGFTQTCDPNIGMQRCRYDAWLRHDYFPAYEVVFERASHDGSGRGCLVKITPTWGPEAGLCCSTITDPLPVNTLAGSPPAPAFNWPLPPVSGWSILP